jgi:hypothetical protein
MSETTITIPGPSKSGKFSDGKMLEVGRLPCKSLKCSELRVI